MLLISTTNLKKLPDESKYQYLWRVCFAKDSGELDCSWDSLAEIINNELGVNPPMGESTYRKPFQCAKAFYDEVFSKMSSTEYERSIVEKTHELMKERQKLAATKIEYARDIRHQSRFEMFYENIKNEVKALEAPDFKPVEVGDKSKDYVLTISDIHAGSNFDIGSNKYSYEEITRRFGVLLGSLTKKIREENISKIKVVVMGDCIQGILRLSDLQLNESSIVEATVFVSKTLAKFLNTLSEYCEIDYYHVPSSNHSQIRPLGTKASEIATEDIEYVIANYIGDAIHDNPRVRFNFNFGEEYIEVPIADGEFTALAAHGHQFPNIESAIKDISFENKKFYDYLFVAHLHSKSSITNTAGDTHDIETLVQPSFVGACPYAKKILRSSKAACCLYTFESGYGLTNTFKIILN